MKKRLLCMLLTLILAIGLFSVSALAEESTNSEIDLSKGTCTITEAGEEATPITGAISADAKWGDGTVVGDVTISGGTASDPIEITVSGTVTVTGTIRLSPDAISNVVFEGGTDGGKLVRGGDFTGQMFYAEGVSGNFHNITFDGITLDGGAIWTGDVDKTLNRGTTNSGVKATGSVLYLLYTNVTMKNNSVLQNHDDSTGEKANAVFLRYYSTITFENSVVRNNNSPSTYYRGGVITVREGGTAITKNSEVYGNSGAAGGFFGISATGSYGGVAEAYNTKFHNNYSDNGAVFLMQCNSNKGYLKIDGCEFYDNASKTAVLTEWAYSRPFIISNSTFKNNECAIWDCHADPVLDISGKIVIEGDPEYTKYLFETPIVLSGPLAEGSSIELSQASIAKLMASGYIVTGTDGYEVTADDLAKLTVDDDMTIVIADVNGDGVGDAVVLEEGAKVTEITLKDSQNAEASETATVYNNVACLPVNPFSHEGLVFAGWVDTDGNAVAKQQFAAATTLTATWKIEAPVVGLSRENATLKATVSNAYDTVTYTYQWYKGGVAIDGATASTYTMTDINSATYKCVVTASVNDLSPVTGEKQGTSSAPAATQVGDTKYATLAEAIAAANAVEGGATVTLHNNVTLSEKLTISGNVTISGAYTITRADTYPGTLFTVNSGATLTLDGGLVIDGNNIWTLNEELYNKTLKLEVSDTTWADLITSETGKPNATAPMFKVTGSVVAKNVTIQNNYSNKASNNGDYGVFQVDANATLTMTGATIKHIVTGGANSVVHLSTNSVWTINDGTLIEDTFAGKNGGICRNDSGLLVMNGGTICTNRGINTNGTVVMLYKGSMEMNGGTLCHNTGISGANNGRCAPIYGHSTSTFVMTGGEIKKNQGISYGGVDVPSSIKVEISGGYIGDNISSLGLTNADVNGNSNTVITGGTFTQDVTQWCAPGYAPVWDEESQSYGVEKGFSKVFYYVVTTDSDGYITSGPSQMVYEGQDNPKIISNGDAAVNYGFYDEENKAYIFTWYTDIAKVAVPNPDVAEEGTIEKSKLSTVYDFASENNKLVDANLKLYGKYETACTVAFDTMGGNGSFEEQIIIANSKVAEPETAPAKTGYIFGGWYTSETISAEKYDFNTAVIADTTLYAKWTPAPLTGTVTVTGTVKVGETLTATVTDTNNIGELSYQWYRHTGDADVKIDGATDSTYQVTEDDVLWMLYCVVSSDVQTDTVRSQYTDIVPNLQFPEGSISAEGYSGQYDGASHSITVTYPAGASVSYSTDGENYSAEKPEFANAGSHTVYYRVYQDKYGNVYGSAAVTITPKALTVTAEDKEAYIGDAQPELTYTTAGFVGDDTFITEPSCTTDAIMYRSGTYTITASGADAGTNYTVTYVSGTLTVKDYPYVPLPIYDVEIADGIPGGEVSVNKKFAYKGNTVTITVTPNEGYELTELTVTDSKGNVIEMSTITDGKYSFNMPEGDVTIDAVFAQLVTACPGDDTCHMHGYTDLSPNEWYHEAVDYVLKNNLMQGVSLNPKRFDPHGELNRGMLIQLLYNLEGKPSVAGTEPFTDVDADDWYHNAVIWAYENKLVNGNGDGTCTPEDAITREEMVTLLYRYAKLKGYDVSVGEDTNILSYEDALSISEWAIEAFQWSCGAGLVSGDGSSLLPADTAQRVEVAQLIMNFLEKVAK